jgi:hypothetical protein
MPTEHNNFQQPITVTQNGQSVYYLWNDVNTNQPKPDVK